MATDTFTLTIHMVSSLDGYIAKRDNSVSWFETPDHYEKGVGELNTEEFFKSADCYVMGAKTYEHAVELSETYGWPYGEIPTFVLTHRNLPVHLPNIQMYSGNLEELVNTRLKPNYNSVWVVGGAVLVKNFFRLNLVNEIRQSILPILLGDGLPFYDQIGREQPLHLKGVTAFKTGMVELSYEVGGV